MSVTKNALDIFVFLLHTCSCVFQAFFVFQCTVKTLKLICYLLGWHQTLAGHLWVLWESNKNMQSVRGKMKSEGRESAECEGKRVKWEGKMCKV